MRIPTRSFGMACVLLVALLVTGCAGMGVKEAQTGEELFLEPAAARGAEPFTDSTAAVAAPPPTPPSPTTAAASQSVTLSERALAPLRPTRTLSGATPGLYRGAVHVAGCDVERQIGYLAADPARGEAFAAALNVTRSQVPRHLRSLTPVVLRADTRVTNHGYRDGQAVRYQSVLQAGTAVLVDDRGVPRVRCACGNPLGPPGSARGVGVSGSAWSTYEPNQVVVVTPAPRAVASLTLLDADGRTWIERRTGPDVRHDRVVPAPAGAAATAPADPAQQGATGARTPDTGRPSASGGPSAPPPSAAARTDGRAAPADGTAMSPEPGLPALPKAPAVRVPPSDPLDEVGPPTVPELPDPPDGGGLIPEDVPDPLDDAVPEADGLPDAPDAPDAPNPTEAGPDAFADAQDG
ncbi:DUF6777 domain-containing protein [Streptomyces sp. NPDC096032]|uniref:DUF6777 domain-containing protein n=1 Tax=Streptomyces sp. NPDC096032 TaxID=3366070 RepID=UPI003806FD0D